MSRISVLIRLLIIIAGIAVLAIGWSFPTITCVSGTGIETACNRDYMATVTSATVFLLGAGVAVAGSASLYAYVTNRS